MYDYINSAYGVAYETGCRVNYTGGYEPAMFAGGVFTSRIIWRMFK